MQQKFKRSQKEISYYQGKFDESELTVAILKSTVNTLTNENVRLQNSINEKNSTLEVKSRQVVKVKAEGVVNRKPEQVRKIMKLYLKYMFSNPFITRVRVHSDLKLPSLRDLHKTPALTSDQIPFNLRLLLKKSETLNEGGQGVSLIANLSLRDLMKRWASFMLERALTKL